MMTNHNWFEKNNVIVDFISQQYDDICKIYAQRSSFEYVGEGNSIGSHVRFLVDIPGYKAGEVIWTDHVRRLGEGSKLIITCSESKLDELRRLYNPKPW